jgi:UDP-glucose 4-epimerase
MTLAHLIAELSAKPLHIRTGPPRAGEIRHSLGLPDSANAALGLPERTSLRDGLAKVLAWLAASK